MLRLWPEHIRIGLGASYAALAYLDGAKVMHWRMQTWTPSDTGMPWQPGLTAISDWLAELKPRASRIGIALSSELAPLHLLPWRDDMAQADQLVLLAADHFRRIYGETTQHWKVTVRPTGYGQPWVAAASDERLQQALPDQWQGMSVTSLQPLAISLFNRLHRQVASNGWLLAPEPAHMTALHVREKQWALLRTFPDAGNGPLNDRLLRETRLAALADLPATVYSPATAISGATLLDPGWRRGTNIPANAPLHLLGGYA